MPAASQTFAGILEMTTRLRTEMGIVDRIMHEVNGKIMRSPSSLDLKRAWIDVYDRWNALALNHPLIASAEPRLPLPEIQSTASRVVALKTEGLSLYARWKADMAAAGIPTTPQQAGMNGAAPTVTQQAEQQGPGALKVCLYGAALLGGAAAISTLWASWRKPPQPVYPAIPPGMFPSPIIPSLSPMGGLMPALSPMGSLGTIPFVLPTIPALSPLPPSDTMAFSIPPDAEELEEPL